MEPIQNVCVIIRSAHERTEDMCRKLILDQGIEENRLFVVHEVPFSAAMKKSFEIGLEQNKKWTYCIDADVLLRPGSIKKMVEFAGSERSDVCEIQGFVMDKYFGGPRQAGNHLYRTSLLDKVISSIPDEGTNIRPERYTLGKMAEQGYPWKSVPYIVGIHDDEQFNFDIYRKAFVHGKKHLDRAELLITRWREKSNTDTDFKVALHAFSDSIKYGGEAFINSKQPLYREKFEATGFLEKEPLGIDSITGTDIESVIEQWEYSDLYYVYFPDRDGLDYQQVAVKNKIKRNIRNKGFIKTMKLAVSEIFLNAGKKIRKGV